VILLDTDLPENRADDRLLTHSLYGGDDEYRIKQEIVLGLGGIRMLQALGFKVRHHHMNEGHSALLALELLRRHARTPEFVLPGESPYDIPRVRALNNFTTHTPLEAGHDRFDYGLVERVLDDFVDFPTLRRLAGDNYLNMTRLALNLSEYINGVARRHAKMSEQMFPGRHVHAISNGVHPYTWTAPAFRRLYDRYVPGWDHDSVLLTRADHVIPDAAVWEAHAETRQVLIETVRARTGVSLQPSVPILGFARRMTAYKRPDLLFTDPERLRAIARRHPFQLVIAGKAHPRDERGKRLIEIIHGHMHALSADIPIAYLPDYDMDLGLSLVAGSDIWLNTPQPPFEASGTSGMKAAFNGVPQLSILDGWWMEACIDGINGWSIGTADVDQRADGAAAALYEKLEQLVLPKYANGGHRAWITLMKGAIAKSAAVFGSHRMMRRYATEAYLW
jgi:starch phosphorylase